MIDVWRSMISGPPIDEQRASRIQPQAATAGQSDPEGSAVPLEEPVEEDSDEEQDPNEFGRAASSGAPQQQSNPYDDGDSSDESEYE